MAISVGWVSFNITEGTGERDTVSLPLGERSAALGHVLCDVVRPHHAWAGSELFTFNNNVQVLFASFAIVIIQLVSFNLFMCYLGSTIICFFCE